MRFHISPHALQVDYVEFPNQSFARTDARMMGQPHVSMFRGHQLDCECLLDALPGIGANHRQPGGIHLQESAVSRDHLDALWGGLRYRSQQLRARIQITACRRILGWPLAAEHCFYPPHPARNVALIYTDPRRKAAAESARTRRKLL